MIYRVLSEPCVYISCYYGNVQGAAGSRQHWYSCTHSRGTLSRHRFGTARTVTTTGLVVGVWRGKTRRTLMMPRKLIVIRFKIHVVSLTCLALGYTPYFSLGSNTFLLK